MAAAKIIKEVHDCKAYKDEFNTFEEFCQHHFGVGRQAFYDDFKILQHLAEEFCRAGDKIGLLYSDIRRMARLQDKNLVATGDKIITIEDTSYELTPENTKEIQEAITELSTRVQAEKRKADGYEKMAKNRAEKTAKLEIELGHMKNPNPHKTHIENLIEELDDQILIILDRFKGVAQLILKKEKETGERAPEREYFMAIMGKLKLGALQAITNTEDDLGELSRLEINKIWKEASLLSQEGEDDNGVSG